MTGDDLKRRRIAAGMSQEQLARELEVALSTVARWEQLQGNLIPSSRMIELALESLERKKKGRKS